MWGQLSSSGVQCLRYLVPLVTPSCLVSILATFGIPKHTGLRTAEIPSKPTSPASLPVAIALRWEVAKERLAAYGRVIDTEI